MWKNSSKVVKLQILLMVSEYWHALELLSPKQLSKMSNVDKKQKLNNNEASWVLTETQRWLYSPYNLFIMFE